MREFSIILPVKNGGHYIKESVQSVLQQTYEHYELMVLIHDCTDDTLQYLQGLESNKIKIEYASNIDGITGNWARITTVPKMEFMTILGYDDVLDKNYLYEMNQLIASYPGAGLYQAHFRYIDGTGQPFSHCTPMPAFQDFPEAMTNFMEGKTDLMATGFIMRSQDYDSIGGIPLYPNLLFADMQLLIDLSKNGGLAVTPKELFSYRKHPAATTSVSSDQKFFSAFEKLVAYFEELQASRPDLKATIAKGSIMFLDKYCQGITHKILKTPKKSRVTPSVAEAINIFTNYGKILNNGQYDPLKNKSVRLGKIIDQNLFLHSLFLMFKKLYKKPVLAS